MLTQLRLLNFRCYGNFRWKLPAQGGIIFGQNAEGKTSLLEAVCYLLRLQSPRTSRMGYLIKHDCSRFGVKGKLVGQTRRIHLADGKTSLQVDGMPRKDNQSYLKDSIPVVWLGNADLELVKGRADARRKYLDFLGIQWHPAYRSELSRYQRALMARNKLLKFKPQDSRQLDAYTVALVEHGSALTRLRTSLVNILKPYITQTAYAISGASEIVEVHYQASAPDQFAQLLRESLRQDIKSGQTHIGPHRDDLVIHINGAAAAQYASEGQQRGIAIAIKLAQSALLQEETGHTPIHLIDDVFGELDPGRRMALLNLLPKDSQNIITTTHLDWLEGKPPLPVYQLNEHILREI